MKMCPRLSSILWMPFRYFTQWTWIGFSFFPQDCRNFNHVLLSSIGGFYITYFYPKQLFLPIFEIVVSGPQLWILDAVSHHSLLVFYFLYRRDYIRRALLSDFWEENRYIFLYLLFFLNPKDYGLRWLDVMSIGAIYGSAVWIIKRRMILST